MADENKKRMTAADIRSSRQGKTNTTNEIANTTSGSTDAEKYAIASRMAQDDLGDNFISDTELKVAIDDIYTNQLGGQVDPSELRGENGATKFISGMKNVIDSIPAGAGSVVDGVYDATIGSLTNTQDLFDGNDLAIPLDIAMDLGLAAIPGVGIPLAVGKNVIQQSDNIYELMSGRDPVTLEKQSGLQQLGNLGETLLSTAPMGKAAATFNKASKAAKAAAKESAEETAEAGATKTATEAAEETTKAAAKEGTEEAASETTTEAAQEGKRRFLDRFSNAKEKAKPKISDMAKAGLSDIGIMGGTYGSIGLQDDGRAQALVEPGINNDPGTYALALASLLSPGAKNLPLKIRTGKSIQATPEMVEAANNMKRAATIPALSNYMYADENRTYDGGMADNDILAYLKAGGN